MREAFCALVVHLTLRWLHFSWDDYFHAVWRILVKEIGDLELAAPSSSLFRGGTTADDVAYAPTSAPTEGNEPKRLHSEGSQGHGNNEQGAPNEAIKKDHDSIDGNALIPFANHTGEPSQTKEGNEDFSRARPKKVPSTKDRNATARTELEDSVDDSSQGTNRCTLPSPRTEHISLLNIDEPKRWMRRRKVNKWTYEEENALAEGVRKYGYQWTRILETYQEISRERTSVDLKDKWRNLQRK
ncbi:telomeric repeat-binding factor 2-like [Hibiscus syriacus]|uniref:telomeric repeat-binding factor 2-like n=1 Tax=Hibiscus syriacus TaxID=106335 RepID=UPI001923715C|nr:telomeric repeat-binding factor 2-like [Hibiscus syriacus]